MLRSKIDMPLLEKIDKIDKCTKNPIFKQFSMRNMLFPGSAQKSDFRFRFCMCFYLWWHILAKKLGCSKTFPGAVNMVNYHISKRQIVQKSCFWVVMLSNCCQNGFFAIFRPISANRNRHKSLWALKFQNPENAYKNDFFCDLWADSIATGVRINLNYFLYIFKLKLLISCMNFQNFLCSRSSLPI